VAIKVQNSHAAQEIHAFVSTPAFVPYLVASMKVQHFVHASADTTKVLDVSVGEKAARVVPERRHAQKQTTLGAPSFAIELLAVALLVAVLVVVRATGTLFEGVQIARAEELELISSATSKAKWQEQQSKLQRTKALVAPASHGYDIGPD
jgi:hypothetical protein